ncbi:hypothetical protein [Coleofasciculus sp.]|uniref:hypothetical protein n=1 Tax=Coleofasciculus sp. TaxID=3100458 RepID=UPI0039F893E1
MKHKPSHLGQYVRSLTPLTALVFAVEISFGTAAQALQFNFSPSSGTSQQALNGFTAAGELWSDLLIDDVTININIDFESLGSGILGQATSNRVGRKYANVRIPYYGRRKEMNPYVTKYRFRKLSNDSMFKL